MDSSVSSSRSPGYGEIVHILLQYEASTDLKNADGWTPLLLAARMGSVDIVAWLLEYGADLEASANEWLDGLNVGIF